MIMPSSTSRTTACSPSSQLVDGARSRKQECVGRVRDSASSNTSIIQCDVEGLGELDQGLQRRLCGSGLVRVDLIDVQAQGLSEALLG